MRIFISGSFQDQKILEEPWVKQAFEEMLADNLTRGHHEKKLSGFKENVCSIRGNIKSRIVYAKMKYQGELCIFILDILPGHDIPKKSHYDSQVGLLRRMGAEELLEEDSLEPQQIIEAITSKKPTPIYAFNQQGIILSDEQHDLIEAQLPLMVNGPPGSGKTSTLFIMLGHLVGQSEAHAPQHFLYVSRTKDVADLMRQEWFASEYAQIAKDKNITIDFKYSLCHTYQDVDDNFLYWPLIDKQKFKKAKKSEAPVLLSLDKSQTKEWFDGKLKELQKRHGVKETTQIDFETFMQETAILGGYSKDAYLNEGFGKRNSLFEQAQKKVVYDLYQAYVQYVEAQSAQNSQYDFGVMNINPERLGLSKGSYDEISGDEIQDHYLKEIELLRQLSAKEQLILSLDTNQDLEKGLSLRPHINRLFTDEHNHCTLVSHDLNKSFRCPKGVVELANVINQLKRGVTGGASDKTEYLCFEPQAHQSESGQLRLVGQRQISNADDIFKTFKDTEIVVVAHPESVKKAKALFPDYTVYTPEKIKGLEYPCVIVFDLLNTTSLHQANKLLGRGFTSHQHRAKADESQPEFAPDFNKLFVSITRVQQALVMVQDSTRNVSHILSPIRKIVAAHALTQKDMAVTSDKKTSLKPVTTQDDWLEQVQFLLRQGKKTIARQVFDERLKKSLDMTFDDYLRKDASDKKASKALSSTPSLKAPTVEKTNSEKRKKALANQHIEPAQRAQKKVRLSQVKANKQKKLSASQQYIKGLLHKTSIANLLTLLKHRKVVDLLFNHELADGLNLYSTLLKSPIKRRLLIRAMMENFQQLNHIFNLENIKKYTHKKFGLNPLEELMLYKDASLLYEYLIRNSSDLLNSISAQSLCRVIPNRPFFYDNFCLFHALLKNQKGQGLLIYLFNQNPKLCQEISMEGISRKAKAKGSGDFPSPLLILASSTSGLAVLSHLFSENRALCLEMTGQALSEASSAKTGSLAGHSTLFYLSRHIVGREILYNLLKIKPDLARQINIAILCKVIPRSNSDFAGQSAFFWLVTQEAQWGILNTILDHNPDFSAQMTGKLLCTSVENTKLGVGGGISPLFILSSTAKGQHFIARLFQLNPKLIAEINGQALSSIMPSNGVFGDESSLFWFAKNETGQKNLNLILDKNPNIAKDITASVLCHPMSSKIAEFEDASPLYCLAGTEEGHQVLHKLFVNNSELMRVISYNTLFHQLATNAFVRKDFSVFVLLNLFQSGQSLLGLVFKCNQDIAKEITIEDICQTIMTGESNILRTMVLSWMCSTEEGLALLELIFRQNPRIKADFTIDILSFCEGFENQPEQGPFIMMKLADTPLGLKVLKEILHASPQILRDMTTQLLEQTYQPGGDEKQPVSLMTLLSKTEEGYDILRIFANANPSLKAYIRDKLGHQELPSTFWGANLFAPLDLSSSQSVSAEQLKQETRHNTPS